MNWEIQWAWNNENISSWIDETDIAERIALLETQSDSRWPIIEEENNDRIEDARDLLRLMRDSWNIDMDEVRAIEAKYWVSWDEIKEESNGISSRNDTWLEIADSEIGLMVFDVTSLPIEEWWNEKYTSMMTDIKAVSLKRGWYYHIDSFFSEWEIVEGDVHFYPSWENSIYWQEPIRVGENTSLKDIGVQLIQWLMDGWTYVEWWENNWDLVTQIEQNYGVNWDEVREMA
jgi:hypothetical protein